MTKARKPRSRLSKRQQQLVIKNLRLISFAAHQFYVGKCQRAHIDACDRKGEAALGVCRAARHWRPTGSKFSSYAFWWVKSALQVAITRNQRQIGLRLIGRPILLASELEEDDLREHADDYRALQRGLDPLLADLSEVLSVVRALPKRRRRIVQRYFGLEGRPRRTLEEIGQEMNVTRERIRQLLELALDAIRHQLHLLPPTELEAFNARPWPGLHCRTLRRARVVRVLEELLVKIPPGQVIVALEFAKKVAEEAQVVCQVVLPVLKEGQDIYFRRAPGFKKRWVINENWRQARLFNSKA